MRFELLARQCIITVSCSIFLAAVGLCTERTADARGSIRDARGPTIKLRLLNASTGQPVIDSAVTVRSDNGIRCFRAPCPTNSKTWQATSDAQGYLEMPIVLVQFETHIDAASLSGELIEDSAPAADGTWVVELLPSASTDPTPTESPRPLKLIDAHTGKAIGSRHARFEFRKRGGSPTILETTTNVLGYVFLPFDIPAGAADNTWVTVAGYRKGPIDFAWARHRTRLQPR